MAEQQTSQTEQAMGKLERDTQGYAAASVLAALAELDLGTLLLTHNNSLTAAELASLAQADVRAITVLLDALAALGYCVKSGTDAESRYGVVAAYRELLDSRHPASYIPMMRHRACIMRNWARLAWTVQSGLPQESQPSLLGREQDRVSFIMGMNSVALRLAPRIVQALEDAGVFAALPPAPRLLDVGGASGTYTAALLEHLPKASACLFDLPTGIRQAEKRFAQSPLSGRVRLVTGDFTKDLLPGPCDFAWVSAIIHQMDRQEARALYAKVRDALAPGGLIAIRDFVMNPERTAPVGGALFGINMLVQTGGGRVYTLEEIRDDLVHAGFTGVRLAVPAEDMGAVVTASKAAL